VARARLVDRCVDLGFANEIAGGGGLMAGAADGVIARATVTPAREALPPARINAFGAVIDYLARATG
jgi:folate-dependent tRNA-U54 methylase TrmFO/GidA